jgi:hypothetical protein
MLTLKIFNDILKINHYKLKIKDMDPSAHFEKGKNYLIKNVKCGKYIQTYSCKSFLTPLAADGIRGTSSDDATVFCIETAPLMQSMKYHEDWVVALRSSGNYVNRWHGGDSDGTEIGMYSDLDDNCRWLMSFVEGKPMTVTF